MSIDIDWESLTTGPEGDELAHSIRDFIHDKFQRVQLPRFIRSVNVHSFDFGTECPVIQLKDISDPLPEFYEDDDDEDSNEDISELHNQHGETETIRSNSGAMRPPENAPSAPASPFAKPNYIDTRPFPNLRGLAHQEQISTPFLSRSSTPGIPGGTSNLSYFHLPLGAGLSGAGLSGTQTPLAAAVSPFAPPPWQQQQQQHGEQHQVAGQAATPLRLQHQQQQQQQGRSTYADPTSRPSTSSKSYATPLPFSPTFPPPQPSPPTTPPPSRALDLQTTLRITYIGSLSLSLTAEILLDYPMPSFVGIPLKLQITGLSFDGVGVVAYLRGGEGGEEGGGEGDGNGSRGGEGGEKGRGMGKVCFSFMEGDDGDDDEDGRKGDAEVDGIEDGRRREEKNAGDGLLREIKVESEIGRQEGGKQVLKNVGKVEKFVLEQVRRIFEEEFVWPSFWTVLV